jgi:protein-L-isoaspartate O-methyltransferase
LEALQSRPLSGRVLDIGSGDGRVVMATAHLGFRSTGVELNPWLVFYSRLRAWRLGLDPHVSFVRTDLWKFDLKPFDNVVIFGVDEMMLPLKDKFEKELKLGSRIVACRFPVEEWKPSSTIGEGIDTVWVYDR